MSNINYIWVDDTNYQNYEDYDDVVRLPVAFKKYWRSDKPYQIWKGSRFSAKSITKAIEYLDRCLFDTYFRGLFARNTAKAARDSQFRLFKDLLDLFPCFKPHFEVKESAMMLVAKNGNYIQGGSFENSDALLSVPELTDFWCEEPIGHKGSIKRNDFLSIAGTLRNSKGIAPRFHFTFNPIGKDNFIYQDFFGKDVKYKEKDVSLLTVNYPDNPFCPQDRKDFLDNLKGIDPQRYIVDALGEWGEPSNDMPFFSAFDYNINVVDYTVKPCPEHPILLSFDFNVDPCTCVAMQLIKFDSELEAGLHMIETIQAKGGTEELCRVIKSKGYMEHWGGINVTGDTSGSKRHTSSNEVDYDIIKRTLGITDMHLYNTKGRNSSLIMSRDLCNYVLYHVLCTFYEPNNELLVREMQIARRDKDGKLFKNRQGHEHDASDAWRYGIHFFFFDGVEGGIHSVVNYLNQIN